MSLESTLQIWIEYLDTEGYKSQLRFTEYERAGFPELFREAYLLHNRQREPDIGVPMLNIKAKILQVDIYDLAKTIVDDGEKFKLLSSIIGSFRVLGEHLLDQNKDNPTAWPAIIANLKVNFHQTLTDNDLNF